MPSIAIDCRFASSPAGLGRYTRNIVGGLIEQPSDISWILLVRSSYESWLESYAGRVTLLEADVPHYSLAEQWKIPSLLRLSNADVFFSPHFLVPFRCPIPFVSTVHDLILHRFPNNASFLKQAAYRLLMRHSVLNAKALCVPSSAVAQDIKHIYGEHDIRVTGEGIEDVFSPASEKDILHVRQMYNVPEQFFLYIGNAKQHKNVQLLIDAHKESGSSVPLILVSHGPEVGRLQLHEQVRLLGEVKEVDLPALYSAASCFTTATLAEGYCLPVCEALACGCPVIASAIEPIISLAGNYATLVPPTKESFAQAFTNLPATRRSVRIGSWEDASQKTLSVLRGVLRATQS